MGVATRTYECDELYSICSKLQYSNALYGSTMHVALSPGAIPRFAELHTEKLAFQCVALLSWEEGPQAMNLGVLCGDFRTIFFKGPTD